MTDRAADDEPATLQSRLESAEPRATGSDRPAIADLVALLSGLERSGHFYRDGRMGRLYHAGMISFRENVPNDSLHVSIDDNHLMAHVDDISPLTMDTEGRPRYSVARATAHNVAGATHDLISLLRGRQGDHRCELDCEWFSGAPDRSMTPDRLLDPETSSWSVHVEARVAGSLDAARLRASIGVAVGQPETPPDCLQVIDCDDDDALGAARTRLHRLGVPVTRSPPFQVCLARHPGGDVVMINLNHAAADGFGAMRLLDRITQAYADPDGQDPPLEFLASLDLPIRPASARVPILVRASRTAMARLRDVLAPHTRLAGAGGGGEPGDGFHLVALSADETPERIHTTRADSHTDVLLAAVHLAIDDWNRQHGTTSRRIGVLVPINLRSSLWREDAIGNFSVNTRLSTTPRHRASPQSALWEVRTQAIRNIRTRTGIALMAALERAGLLPLWAKQSSVVLQPLSDHLLIDTALLCDLGTLDSTPTFGADAGDTLEVWFSTPTRSPLMLSIGAVRIEGRLHLTFRYPHRLFSADSTRRFAECYLAHLRQIADSAA